MACLEAEVPWRRDGGAVLSARRTDVEVAGATTRTRIVNNSIGVRGALKLDIVSQIHSFFCLA